METEQELGREPVTRLEAAHFVGVDDRELLAQRGRQTGHLRRVKHAAAVDPLEELPPTIRGLVERDSKLLELLWKQASQ